VLVDTPGDPDSQRLAAFYRSPAGEQPIKRRRSGAGVEETTRIATRAVDRRFLGTRDAHRSSSSNGDHK